MCVQKNSVVRNWGRDLYDFQTLLKRNCGPGRSVGIATGLRARRSGDRIPVEPVFPPVQTGPVAHPASCTMGTMSFLGVKYGRSLPLTTHPFLVPWSWKSRVSTLRTLWDTTGPTTGKLYLLLKMNCYLEV